MVIRTAWKYISLVLMVVPVSSFAQVKEKSEVKNKRMPITCTDYLLTESLVGAYHEWIELRTKVDLQISNECTEGLFADDAMPTVYSCHQEEYVLAKHLKKSIPLASLVREVDHQVGNDDRLFAFIVVVEAHGRNLNNEYRSLFERINDQYAKSVFFKESEANKTRHYLLDEESRKLLSLVVERLNRPNTNGGFCTVSADLLKSEKFSTDVVKTLRNYHAMITEKPLEMDYKNNIFDDADVLKTSKMILQPNAITSAPADKISSLIEAEAMRVLSQYGKDFMSLEKLD